MLRKIILLALSLGFLAGGAAFTLSEWNLAAATGEHDHIYAALFGGALLGFVGLMLLFRVFRKPGTDAPGAWAVGMTTLGKDRDAAD